MKNTRISKFWMPFILVLVPLVMMACLPTLSNPGGSGTDVPVENVDTPVPQEFSDADFDYGTGPFTLLDPATGLDAITSYHATFTVSFDGQNNGSPEQWSSIYTATVSRQEAPFYQLVVESTGQMDGESLTDLYSAESNRTLYRQVPGEDCTVEILAETTPTATDTELANGLPSLHGADEAGAEDIGGVQTQHYTFDARAMGLSGMGTGSGEIWVASEGGYVVRYSASFEGTEEYFGEGVSGTITWEYELNDIDQPARLEIPSGCSFGRVDAPLMADATDVVEDPGFTSYNTTSTIQAVMDFYTEQMPASGWEIVMEPSVGEQAATVIYGQGETELTVTALTKDTGTEVWLLMERTLQPFPDY